MSRLYPQWIDVAKLIEPLHSHLQQQQQLMQQSNDNHQNQIGLDPSSSSEDNLNGNPSEAPNGGNFSGRQPTSLRSGVLAASPLTDSGQQPSKNLSPVLLADHDEGKNQLSRTLSCSIMTSDSGHSSTSTSPSSAMSTSFDSCGEMIGTSTASADARARRQNFQKAQIQSQQLQSNQCASYLKRKCYQQRQQQLSLIDCKSESGNISSLISSVADAPPSQPSHQSTQGGSGSVPMEFSLRERRFECIRVVRQLLEALNETNLILLRAIICVLWHIADNSDYNKMSSSNLGVCIGQSLLNDELQQQQHSSNLQHRGKKLHSFGLSISSASQLTPTTLPDPRPAPSFTKRHRRARSQCLLASTLSLTNLSHLSTSSSPTNSLAPNGAQLASSLSSNYLDSSGAQETAKFVPILVAFMIDNAKELFGSDVMNLFGPHKPLRGTEIDDNQQKGNPDESIATMNHEATLSIGASQQLTGTDEQPNSSGKIEAQLFESLDTNSEDLKSIVVTRDQTQPHCSDLIVKLSSDSTSVNNQAQQSSQAANENVHLFPKCKPVLVVHIGNQMTSKTGDHVSSGVGMVSPTNNSETKREPTSDAATSILIVNTPKNQDKQQRPLSATESTTSSSRASSSTSGVHSESPAFSCERDSASSSASPHNSSSAQTTNTCSSPASSRCVSISSPSSSSSAHSSCTSPTDMDHSSVDVVDGNHNRHDHHVHPSNGNAAKTISRNEAMRHNLAGQLCLPQSSATTTGDMGVPVCESRLSLDQNTKARGRRRTSFERPKSMISLSRQSEPTGAESLQQKSLMQYSNDGRVRQQQYSSIAFDTVNKENVNLNSVRRNQFQSHTLNRHRSASSQLVNINRMPKIPFQYTTSCYGGEAVLFYPTNAHLSQQQQPRATAIHQHGDRRLATPSVQPRGCNRIQSLDRLSQMHHSSSHLHQQQLPQRSHVMMLRDYYLSLQEQSQQQQQYRELVKRHQCKQQMLGKEQKPSVTNAATISNHFQLIHHQQQHQPQSQPQFRQQVMMVAPASIDPRQQRARSGVTIDPNAMQASDDATKTSCNGNHEMMREQPASVAVAHQRVQPRTAHIRPNQFNGLYVKRATSPMGNLGSANLITLDHHHRHQASSSGKPLATAGNPPSNLMAISQSSLSQQSSKMSSSGHSSDDDERDCSSDDCSTSGWMESTMV